MSVNFLYDEINYFTSGGIELYTNLILYNFTPTPDVYRMDIRKISFKYELPVVTLGHTGGVIDSYTIVSGGFGNNSLALPVVGGAGVGAVLTPTVDVSGTLTGITITNGGSGYSTPTTTPTSTPPAADIFTEVSNDNITYVPVSTLAVDTTEKDFTDNVIASYKYYRLRYAGGLKTQLKIFSMIAYTTTGAVTGAKIVDFVFNLDQKYVLVLRDSVIYIYQNDVQIDTVVATGLLESYFPTLKYAQAEDTMIFTHPDMITKQLVRSAGPVWTWGDFPWTGIPKYAFAGETITNPAFTLTPSAVEGSVKLTHSGVWPADCVGQYVDGNGGRARITERESNTVAYGFTVIPFYTTAAIASGQWEYITGYEDVWSATRGYPSTCMFYEQRLWFGGSKSRPNTIWGSRVAQYNSFENIANYDNDSIEATISSAQIDEIVNIYANRGIQVFTAGAEWIIPETNLTPDTLSITKNTSNGSLNTVNPVDISGTTLFVEKNGKSLLSFVYDYNQGSYMTSSMSLLTDLIVAPVRMAVDYNSSQDVGNFLYMVLTDGTMIMACILLDQKINSFVRYETNGLIKDIVNVAGDTYLLVERHKDVYLEKVSNSPIKTDFTSSHAPAQIISSLVDYENETVYAYTATTSYGTFDVSGGLIDLGVVPTETVYVGLGFAYALTSNKIAIDGQTDNIEKRIAKATVVTKDTDRLIFEYQDLAETDDVYDVYGVTGFEKDCRFHITGEFDYIEIMSILLNINFGAK